MLSIQTRDDAGVLAHVISGAVRTSQVHGAACVSPWVVPGAASRTFCFFIDRWAVAGNVSA
eukprot:5206723-Pleurochrysis_carterae.AAC.5